MNSKETLAYFQGLQPVMLGELLQWVEIESPTTNKEAVDRFGTAVAAKFSEIGMSIEFDQQSVRGNHLIARWWNHDGKILLIGHLDTVWDLGIFEQMPIRVEGDVASGPGIYDMKGGILVALFALRRLREEGMHHNNITVLLVSDEEEGSDTSRALIEREASSAQCALILEPAGPNNSLKTKRRGTGHYKIVVHGKAAHAGVEPGKGISAIQELAHQILALQGWNQLREGISVNVGIVHGGTRTNVVPAEAVAEIDLRCDTPDDVAWLKEQFRKLQPKLAGAVLEVTGDFDRPPLVRSEKVLALYKQALSIADSFEDPVTEFWTGGASDGNFTAALGIPTLDGLGPQGAGAHALHEHILVSSLPKRANLLYHLIRKHIS